MQFSLARAVAATALVTLLASGMARAQAPDSAAAAPPDSLAPSTPMHVTFQHFEVDLPGSEGWELKSRAAEDEAITVQLVWKKNGEKFRLGEIEIARVGLFDPSVPRQPRPTFDAYAASEVRLAQADAAQASAKWLGSQRDSMDLGSHTLYRLWYAAAPQGVKAESYQVYVFPATFTRDGFFLRATLRMWSTPEREDLSILDDFKTVARSLRPRAVELDRRVVADGPDRLGKAHLSLPWIYYDFRARVLNSPHDTTQAPCWTQLEDTVAVGLQATRQPGVVFFSFLPRVPAGGERTTGERFGKAFDRDGDGRFDLAFFSEGWAQGQDQRRIRTFYVVADDDGDGRVDGVIYEDGDNSGDALVDNEVFAQDRAGKGEPDRAWMFDTDIGHPVRPIPRQGTVFFFGRASRPGGQSFDLAAEFRDWSAQLARLNRAAAACAGKTHRRR